MKKLLRIILIALIAGSVSVQAAVKRQSRNNQEINEPEVTEVIIERTEVIAADDSHEHVIFDQLIEVVGCVHPGIVDCNSANSKKALIQELPQKTREQAFEKLVDTMMNDGVQHPFRAPHGKKYTQLDMFFILSKELMHHDQELGNKLESCVGEKKVQTLGKKLNGCLDRTPEGVKNKLSPKKLGIMEKVRLFKLITNRMNTTAKH